MTGAPKRNLKAVPPPSAVTVAEALRDAVLEIGTADVYLGSEQDLLDRYGVSAPTLRQAVRLLEQQGLLIARRGVRGGYYTRMPEVATVVESTTTFLRSRNTTVKDILDTALVLNPYVAELAARNPDDEARASLLAFVEEYQARDRADEMTWFVGVIAEIGHRLGQLSGNPVAAVFADTLASISLTRFPERPFRTAGRIEAVRALHRVLAEAVAAGDAGAASEVMTELMRLGLIWTQAASQPHGKRTPFHV